MSEWITSKLSDIAVFEKGRKVETAPTPHGGWLPYLGASAIEGKVTAFANPENGVIASENDLLLLWDGERSGLIGRAGRGVVGSTVARISSRGVGSDFLYYSLQRSYPWIQARRTGTGIPHVPSNLGDWLELLHPASLKEQNLISRILFSLDTQIQKTEELVAKLEKVKEGLLQDLLTRGIDENGQLRPSPEQAPELYKESPLRLIPREWKVVSFQDIYESFPDGNYADKYPKSSDFVDHGVPFLRANNIKEGTVIDSDLLYITEQQHSELKRGHLKKGDYLITTRGEIGNTARVPSRFIGANVNAQIVILRSRDRSLNEYIAAYSETSGFKAQVISGQTGTALKQLPTGNLKRLLVPLPEKDERTRISQTINNSKKQRKQEKDKCAALYALKQGLMDDLLTGRVRVTPLLGQAQAQTTTPA